MESKLSKSEILNETIQYYSEDTNRRAVKRTTDGTLLNCMYNTENGNHCAIGRCLKDKHKEKGLDFKGNHEDAWGLNEMYGMLDNILEEKYHGHVLEFWEMLQNLHDTDANWNEHGLTLEGEEYVQNIKSRFHLK